MILTSDLRMFNSIWDEAERKLKDEMKLFSRLIDIYVLACAIGIKEDEIIKNDESIVNPVREINRNTYSSMINTNLREMLEFMLQNALINSKHISFDMDERLKLAFDPDYKNDKISAATFLTNFANYGIVKIMECIKSDSPLVAISELFSYFTILSESRYDEILQSITLDKIN